jgi:hypothetical protein
MINHDDPLLKLGLLMLAAFGGSVTALSFMKWQEMGWGQILLTFFTGFTFAIFVTPWLAHVAFGVTNDADSQTLAGMTYVAASGSNVLLPLVIRWFGRAFGQETKP